MTDEIEFKAWPKMPRLNRPATITEKIDGTNAAVGILKKPFGTSIEFAESAEWNHDVIGVMVKPEDTDPANEVPDDEYWIYAQSRNRIICPGKKTDNAGFAGWVYDNARELLYTLGPGLHFGEWWGKGIQRGYDMDHNVFSLFNVDKWDGINGVEGQLRSVPVLARDSFWALVTFHQDEIYDLRNNGSIAAPGFMKPEGICIYSSSANLSFKVTLDNDESPKSA